jgi:hypothetical protein
VVVTSSRRRSARRPAGPPPGAEQGSVLTLDGSAVGGPDGADGVAAEVAPHVPVKKKGSRKR